LIGFIGYIVAQIIGIVRGERGFDKHCRHLRRTKIAYMLEVSVMLYFFMMDNLYEVFLLKGAKGVFIGVSILIMMDNLCEAANPASSSGMTLRFNPYYDG